MPSVKQLARCRNCGHFATNHHGGGGKPASGRCVAPIADGTCECDSFVEGYEDPLPQGASWYERAINAANRIDTVHTTPWKVAMVYSLLAIAESLGASASTSPPPQQLGESPPRRPGDTDKDLLTAQDVAHMTGLSVHTLSWWRFNGGPGLSISSWVGASSTAAPRLSSGWHAPVSDTADRLAQALRELINEAVRAAVADAA